MVVVKGEVTGVGIKDGSYVVSRGESSTVSIRQDDKRLPNIFLQPLFEANKIVGLLVLATVR